MHVCLKACRVLVIEHNSVSRGVVAYADISSTEGEAITSNALTEEFRIVILNLKKGLWRFSDDPTGKVRSSQGPQF